MTPPRVRYPKPAEHDEIAVIIERAFTEEFGRSNEAELVRRLRADGDVLFELVAEAEGQLVGHILFSRLWADRASLFAAMAPVSVRPGLQRMGTGGVLIRAGVDLCKAFGASGVVVLGHPAYYPKFGFTAAAAAHITSPYAGSPSFMALALEDGAFDAPVTLVYPDAFKG
jgi:putative acetyltransferase